MSTQDIPDNELDDFFKKSLEEPAIDFREEDWLQMEKKLDTAARQKALFRKYLYSFLVLLIGTAVAVFLWVIYNNPDESSKTVLSNLHTPDTYRYQQPESSAIQENRDTFTNQANNIEAESKSNIEASRQTDNPQDKLADSKSTPAIKNKPEQAIPDKQAIGRNDKKKPINKDYSKSVNHPSQQQQEKITLNNSPAVVLDTPVTEEGSNTDANSSIDDNGRITENKKNINKKSSKNKLLTKPSARNDDLTIDNELFKKESEVDDKSSIADKEERITKEGSQPGTLQQNTSTEAPSTHIAGADILHLSTVPVRSYFTGKELAQKYLKQLEEKSVIKLNPLPLADSTDVKKIAIERVNYRFSLSFLLSPDLSTVRLSGLTKPGTNIGLLLAYQFSRKMSIAAGVIRSAKVYDARIEDYSPPPGQWTYYIKPVEIKASCIVLDIPVNIRYDLSMKKNYNLYATVGLSSYLMLSENYRYIYDVDDTYLRKSWEVNNENKHFFKVYNLSAGYEQKLHNRFSVGAEPFLKIPGAGVGFGKIHLWSAGIFISAKYKWGR